MTNLFSVQMESTKIVHIAAEVVLIGAVVFYYNGQLKALKNELREVKQKMQDETIERNKHFDNLYTVVDRMQKSMVHMQQPRPLMPIPEIPMMSLRKRKPIIKVVESTDEDETSESVVEPPTSEQMINDVIKGKIKPSVSKSSEVYNDPESLDKELSTELDELAEDEDIEEISTSPTPLKQLKGMHVSGKATKKN